MYAGFKSDFKYPIYMNENLKKRNNFFSTQKETKMWFQFDKLKKKKSMDEHLFQTHIQYGIVSSISSCTLFDITQSSDQN